MRLGLQHQSRHHLDNQRIKGCQKQCRRQVFRLTPTTAGQGLQSAAAQAAAPCVAAHLLAGQLAALPGLGALRDLDLNLVRVGEVVGAHAKAAAGHLLDGAAQGVTRAVCVEGTGQGGGFVRWKSIRLA